MSFKAFDSIPVISTEDLGGNKFKGCIQCMEMSQGNLYIGTTDRFVFHFAVERMKITSGEEVYTSKLQRKKHLALSKPLKQLLACPVIGSLLILSESIIYCTSMIGLEFRSGSDKELFKGVTVMARNDKPPVFNDNEVQICIGTHRKTVQVIDLGKKQYTLIREINLQASPSLLAMDSETICAAVGRQYYLVNSITSNVQDLFLCEENVRLSIKRTGHEEFLLNGPTDEMGMVVTAGGISQHQPLWWSDGFRSVAYSYPYILVLGRRTVTVHSMLDQQSKQVIPYGGGMFLDNIDGNVFIALEKSLMSLIPIPFSKQIQILLETKSIDEAFNLLLVASQSNPKEYDKEYMKQIHAQAGFIYFIDANFKKALSLFLESSLDPRELIILYPLMMPKDYHFIPTCPSFHNIENLSNLVKGSLSVFAGYKKFLMEFMEISQHRFPKARVEIDTVLMKVYAENNDKKLFELVASKNSIVKEEALSWLSQFKCFHSLALYHSFLGEYDQALVIWYRLLYKELEDVNFPGIEFIVNYLKKVNNIEFLWKSIGWVLNHDQELAVKIFTESEIEDQIDHDKVYDTLQNYQCALQIYLEHIVLIRKYHNEKFNTQLAVLYLDEVLKLLNDNIAVEDGIKIARVKLQTLLETTNAYRISVLLQKISTYPLYEEIAILYGKMDKHDKALKILVYKLKDFKVAERYCNTVCVGRDREFRHKIFYCLLLIYLKPNEEENARPENFVMAAVKLLNLYQNDFNILEVLSILPEDWPIDIISSFLSGSIRTNLSSYYQSKIETRISSMPYVEKKQEVIKRQCQLVKLTYESSCDFCKKPFITPVCIRYPNGIVVHPNCCQDKRVCPVTGQNFR